MGKASLTIAIGGEYKGSSALKKAEAELRALREEARQAGGATSDIMKLGDSMVDLGSNMEAAGAKISGFGTKVTKATAPLAIVGAAAVKLASDYEDSVAKVYTIMDKSTMSTEQMAQSILDLSTKTGKSATELADATYQALSASVATEKVGGFVENAVKLAKSGFTETATAVDTLTTVINAYGYSAEDAQMISDKLVQTQNKGKTTVAELASTIGNVIPTAAAYNVSLDNLCSAYVTLTKQGINTQNATTAINGMLTELADSGSTVAGVLQEKTGKSFGQLMADGADLGEVIQILSDSVDGDSEAFANLWGNVRASKGALAIANAGASEFTATMGAMADSTGLCDQALEDLQTPSAKAGKALNAVKNTGIQLGEEILGAMVPSIEKLSDMAQDLYKWFSELDEGTKQNIVRFGGLAVAAGPVITIFGKLYSGVGSLISHLGKGLQSVGAFSAAMKTTEASMRTAGATTVTLGDKLKGAAEKTGLLTKASNLLKGGLATIGIGAAVALVGVLVGKFMEWKEHTDKVAKATTGLEDAAKKATAAYDAYEPAIEGATKALGNNVATAEEALDSQAKLADTMNSTWKDVNTDAAMIDYYAGVIGELGNKGELTREEYEKLQVAVDEFNRLTGSSVEITNDMTGELNLSKEAILGCAEAYKEEARAAAAREMLIEVNKQMLTDELALNDAKDKLAEAERKQQEYMRQYPDLANPYDQEVNSLREDVDELARSHESAEKSANELMGVITTSPKHFKKLEDALSSCGLSIGDLGDITDEQLAIMEENFDGTLASIYETCVDQGIAIPEGLEKGIESSADKPVESAEQMVARIAGNMKKFLGISSPSRLMQEIGRNIDLGLGNGISGGASGPITAIGSIVTSIFNKTAGLPDSMRRTGASASSSFAGGISSGNTAASNAAASVSRSAQNGVMAAPANFKTTGYNASVGFANGLLGLNQYNYGVSVASKARTGMADVKTYNTGWNFTTGFVNGMNAVSLYNYAWNLASRAVSAVKNCLGIASPSKEAARIGAYFGEGLVLGMESTEDAVASEAARMGGLMEFDPTGYQIGAYGLQAQRRGNQAPGAVTMNVTINVSAGSAAEARAAGVSLADGLYEEITRRTGGELWPASYSAA